VGLVDRLKKRSYIMNKTRKIGDLTLINENENMSYLDRITLKDFQIMKSIKYDRLSTGRIIGSITTDIRDNGHTFAMTQNRVGSKTLYVKQIR